MATTETPAIIVETIAIEAPMTAVFAALTEPDQLAQWWGSPESYHVTKMESDLRAGGAWKTTGIGKTGEPFTVYGVYRTVEAPRLLEFTWKHDWTGDVEEPETVVRYELSERAGATQLTVTHSGFATEESRADHAQGWKIVLGWVRAFVTSPVSRSVRRP